MKDIAQETSWSEEPLPVSETAEHAPSEEAHEEPSWLRRPLVRVNLEIAAYVVLVALSVVAHLWGLGDMAMHHDESIHAWSSWKFYTGDGGFSCYDPNPNDDIPATSTTYCYDPVYHGPSLYILTLLSYFLFGDGDAQARLPMALAGIGLVASCWMLRPLIGKRGAFVAAVLLGFSPSLLYFTRFARHDGLMVLWELWMVIGVFRYLQSGRAGYLYLLAVSLALAVGTHELYYILFFIFGIFLLLRLLAESRLARYLNIALPSLLGLCVVIMVLNPPLPIGQGLYLGEKALLVASALLIGWLCHRVWPREQVVIPRFVDLWRNHRMTLWLALGVLASLYLVQYTTFFSYFRGALDGLYAGIAYWLGSQHEYARGDQPWYYYVMQLPLYEILGVVCGIGAAVYLFTRRATQFGQDGAEWGPAVRQLIPPDVALSDEDTTVVVRESTAPTEGDGNGDGQSDGQSEGDGEGDGNSDGTEAPTASGAVAVLPPAMLAAAIFPLLLVFWYVNAIVTFSWAGEKMPWLLVHMALPGNLLAAWAIGRLLTNIETPSAEEDAPEGRGGLLLVVPPAVLVMLIAFIVFLWRYYSAGEGQEGQATLVQSLVPLIIAGGIFFGLLTLGSRIGMRVLLSLTALTFAVVLGAYMLRSTWLAVYEHPDTPVELLVYTQTSPDVPRYVRDIEELAINLTRIERGEDDITGGLSMPMIVDSGDENGDGSLAWPLQWYLRNFQEVKWKKYETFSDPTADTFKVTFNGEETLAPVVMLYKPHVNTNVRDVLSENYVQPYGEGGALNWWFPEGNKCSPNEPGYKKYYFNDWMASSKRGREKLEDCGDDIAERLHAPWAPLLWPFQAHNWDTLKQFVLFRELPSSLKPGSRPMEVWVRSDLMSGATVAGEGVDSAMPFVRLVAQRILGEGDALAQPTGLTVGQDGRVYVADTLNHRILVYSADGELEQSIGSRGSGEEEFMEPRAVAVDDDGFIYVADTWNARVVKLSADGEWVQTWGTSNTDMGNGRSAFMTGGTQEGNQANPLGFFGPRGIAVDGAGRVYVTDTGNKRVVVTDDEGEYLYQWGFEGSQPGRFDEPTGIGIDESGNVYVADTWNGRVQVFATEPDGEVSPTPVATWRVRGWHPDTYLDPSLAVSGDGTVYVSVPGRSRVMAATMQGDILLSWGGPGNDRAALDSPSGLGVGPDGLVYVADRSQNRVLSFALPAVQPVVSEEGGADE